MAEKAKYASLGSRIVAVIIDHVILAIIVLAIAFPFGLSAAMMAMMGGSLGMASWMIGYVVALNFIIWLVYFSYFESATGQTIGKKVMHIKVVKEGGKKLEMSDALIRTILRIIDGIGAYILGLIVILVSEKKQRIGDMAAGTVVVKE